MQDLQTIEVKGQRVLTTKQIAEAYGTEEDKIRWNYKYNKGKYKEGKHYILIQGEELRELKRECEFHTLLKQAKSVCFWTEKGALLHAKSLNTDKAWEVYDHLVDFYFRAKEEKPEAAQGQKETEKKAVIPVNTRTEKVPEAIEAKTRTIPVFGLNPAKGMVVDIPKNKEALQLIGEMRKYLTGMDALLDTYCMYLKEDEFKKIAYAVESMAGKISRTALFLYTFKPHIVEEYL
jgi:hypothetical protein